MKSVFAFVYLSMIMLAPQSDSDLLDGRGGGIISFNSDRDGNGEVYLMNADGSGQHNITNNPANDGFGSWSPDGNRIAFISDRDGSFGIYLMVVEDLEDGKFENPIKIADKRPSSRVSWSPDGSEIIFDAWPECDIYIVSMNGKHLRKITDTPEQEFQPCFSPDGSRIAFCRADNNGQNICVMNYDGSEKRNLTDDGVSYFPSWSPDGKRIAFNSTRPGRHDVDICIFEFDGNNRYWVTNYGDLDEFPSWSPDGTKIAYQSSRGTHKIYIANSDGSRNRPITDNDGYSNGEPCWRGQDK